MTTQTLSEIMRFGHLIHVTPGLTIEDKDVRGGVAFYAPESVDVETDEDGQILAEHERAMVAAAEEQGWSFMTGYSNQDRYRGPIMHSSEAIGGGMERHIRETPGFYVVVSVEDGTEEGAGWAVLYRED